MDGAWNQLGYDDATALWAQKLKAALAAGGPSSVAVLGGGRLLNEEIALAAHVHRALGIESLDARVGAQRVVHHGGFASHVELENADVIVTVGRPPSQLAPVLDLRIRKAVSRHGARLFSVGDHAANSFVPETHVADGPALRAAFPKDAKRVAVVWDGVLRADDAPFDAFIAELSAGGATILPYVLPETPNGRGADALGMRPGPGGLDTRGILEAARDGKIAVLAILGANPLLRHPDRALVEAALRAVPFVVVSELFLTETAELADLVLPVCSAFEKSGTTTDLAGDVLPVMGAVRPPDDVLADGDVLVMLADALGVALPDVVDLEKKIHELVRTAPANDPAGFASPAAAAPAAGELRAIAETTIFTGGGTLAFDARLAELRTQPRATLHPATAHALGVADGDRVTVSAGAGALPDLVAVLDERVPQGAVALVEGIPSAPLGALGGAAAVRLEKALVTA